MVGPLVVRIRDFVVFLWCALCACAAMCVAHVRAAPPVAGEAQPLASALMRLSAPQDQPLFVRLQGQSSDLAVVLRARATGPLEASLREQLATARALCVSGGERVVIWTARTERQLTVVVADLERERVLVRELARAETELDRSAQEEAAALVVRSALKASLAGEPLGTAERELAPEPEPEPEPEVAPPPPVRASEQKPVAPSEPMKRAWTGLLALGALLGVDGATEHQGLGLSARAALRLARLELGLRGSLGLREPVSTSLASARMAQHRASAYLGLSAVETGPLRLMLAAAVGASVFATRVHSDAALFVAEAQQRALLATLGAGATLSYLPRWTRGRVGLALSAYFEAFPRRLTLGYQTEEKFVRIAKGWRVQPVFGVELVVPWGRPATR